ncbi:AI-2E family transporter [Kordiimonas marina]|uniref:AI-2E family transporter n=1 Tax=Kordiimonas marina TaxID=2872312 RepID=UPI001FF32248|nr:AI-2E family transporter [Kordiimonas marina]MCJ9428924.1 AI-2E family transporter [Kordiimonas marina]
MNRWVWAGTIAVTALFFYLTRGILLPFMAGLAVAYFLDPLADRLEARKVSRGLAAALVIALFFMTIVGVVLAFWPVIEAQVSAAAHTLPKTLAGLRPWLNHLLQAVSDKLGPDVMGDVDSMLGSFSSDLMTEVQAAAGKLLSGGLAVFNVLSLVLISPVVAFYLLRDWDLLVAKIDSWMPPAAAPIVREQASKIDTVLAGFVRGQILVSTTMGVLYATGWSLVGLKSGIALGVLAGIMSFVPFVGALFAAIIAVAMAFGQWGFDPMHLGLVAMIFVIVQAIEGSFLTPRLVGGRVGLHPVWVLFAVFAGGEVMGFVGVLIAVPAAAAIAVLVRFWIERYLEHYVGPKEAKALVEGPEQEEAED